MEITKRGALPLTADDRALIERMLGNMLSSETRLTLERLLVLAGGPLPDGQQPLSRQVRSNQIRKYKNRLTSRLQAAQREAQFMSDRVGAFDRLRKESPTLIAKDLGVSGRHFHRLIKEMELGVPVPRDQKFTSTHMLMRPLPTDPHPDFSSGRKVRASIVDLAGVFVSGGVFVFAFAIYGTKRFLERVTQAQRGWEDTEPYWTGIAVDDVIARFFFRRARDAVRGSSGGKYSPKMVQEWTAEIEKAFPADSDWQLNVVITSGREMGVNELERRVFCLRNRLGSISAFPSLRVRATEASVILPAATFSLAGSGEQTFDEFRLRQLAKLHWQAQGSVFGLELAAAKALTLQNFHWHKSTDVEGRVNFFEDENLEEFVVINAFPGSQMVARVEAKPSSVGNVERLIRKAINEVGPFQRACFVDGIDIPRECRPQFNLEINFGGQNVFAEQSTGFACRVVPRRFAYQDHTAELREWGSKLHKRRKGFSTVRFVRPDPGPEFNGKCDALIFKLDPLLDAIREAFVEGEYNDRIDNIRSWQELSIRHLCGNAYAVPSRILPQYQEHSLGWDVGTWLASTAAKSEPRIAEMNEEEINEALAARIAMCWPSCPAGRTVFGVRDNENGNHPPGFARLLMEVDSDFLISHLSEQVRDTASSQVSEWRQATAIALSHITRKRDDWYEDGVIGHLFHDVRRSFTTMHAEGCFQRASEQLNKYQRKIARMALEGYARQLLKSDIEEPLPYFVLPMLRLRGAFISLVRRIAPTLRQSSIEGNAGRSSRPGRSPREVEEEDDYPESPYEATERSYVNTDIDNIEL